MSCTAFLLPGLLSDKLIGLNSPMPAFCLRSWDYRRQVGTAPSSHTWLQIPDLHNAAGGSKMMYLQTETLCYVNYLLVCQFLWYLCDLLIY